MSQLRDMGLTFKGESLGEVFQKVRNRMLNAGVVQSRNGETKELLNPTIVITDPSQRLFHSTVRPFSLVYALVEAHMLFSTSNNLAPFAMFNKNISDYSDNGMTLNSAYGQFMGDKIEGIIKTLGKDNDSRQAVLSIYNNSFLGLNSKDIPCTLSLHFLIRDGKLNMTTYMRSNDLFWGLQYDVFMFTVLQEVIAKELGIPMGTYTHCPTSLHVYKHHWEMLEALIASTTTRSGKIDMKMDLAQARMISGLIASLPEVVAIADPNKKKDKIKFILNFITPGNIRPYQLVLIEFLYKYDRPMFDGIVGKLDIAGEWFEPFVKRWQNGHKDAE